MREQVRRFVPGLMLALLAGPAAAQPTPLNAHTCSQREVAVRCGDGAPCVLQEPQGMTVFPACAVVAAPAPKVVKKSAPTALTILAGTVVSAGGGATTAVAPLVRFAVDFPVADAEMSPRVRVLTDLTALPGESIDAGDPQTWRAIEFTVAAYQQLWPTVHLAIDLEVGFGSRLGNDPEPQARAARWWSFGVRFGGEAGWLKLGCGMDQRLGRALALPGEQAPLYQPACGPSGSLRLWKQKDGALKGATVNLIGRAVLGLDLSAQWPGYNGGRADIISASIAVGK